MLEWDIRTLHVYKRHSSKWWNVHDLYTIRNYLGVSQDVHKARYIVDKVIVNHDQAQKEWNSGMHVS